MQLPELTNPCNMYSLKLKKKKKKQNEEVRNKREKQKPPSLTGRILPVKVLPLRFPFVMS